MPNYIETGHFFHMVANVGIAAGMLSAATAILIGVYKNTSRQYWPLPGLIAGLFVAAAIGRLLEGLGVGGYYQVAADAAACLFALGTGFVTWPRLKESLSLPTYEQMEQAYKDKQQAFEKLDRQQKIFQNFMENSPALAFLENSHGQVMYVNKSFENHFGIKSEELIGRPSTLWSSPEEARGIQQQIAEVLLEGKPVSRVAYFPKGEGSKEEEPWWVVRFPVPEDHGAEMEGASIGVIAVNLVSEFRSRELHSRLVSIVESTHDAIIGKDLDGNITSWNRGAELLYGYTPSEAIGQNMSILVPPERKNEVQDWIDKVRRGIPVQDHKTVRVNKNGDVRDIVESVSPIRDASGVITGAAVIARDITVLEKQQIEIKELNEQLKSRVYELAESNAALQSARDQALEASNLKSAFVANISHEIRTPLAGILGLNEMLIQNGRLVGDDLQIAQMVQQSAEALLSVVNDILDLSKIEAGKITLEYAPFNPVFLLQDCTRLMAPTAHQRGLEYDLIIDQKIPNMVYGDASRLRQVLLNIIGNAIKFTPQGSVIVRAKVLNLDEDAVSIEYSITDTGIGISQQDQRYLFMPFAQADNSSTRKFGGTGLGLSISKRFVEMMDGEIRVESQKDKGSTFSIRISFDRKKLHEAQHFDTDRIIRPAVEPLSNEVAMGRKILLVEDNAVLQHLALRQLANLGVNCQAVVLGQDAIEMALSDEFDLVLMDINLPDINGLEATAAIRNMEHSRKRAPIPIVAMTAGAMKGDRERAIAAGMNDYLAKPVAIEQLKRTLELWLSKSKVRGFVGSE